MTARQEFGALLSFIGKHLDDRKRHEPVTFRALFERHFGREPMQLPVLTERLAGPIIASGVPYLPGIANAGDIMRGLDLGLTHFKFFPAETSGGLKALKSLAAPFYQCKFCPTGGITEASAPDWLAFDPVLCVGGSWVTGGTMAEVEAKARAAAGLRG